jgi:hypothetical protein
MAVRGDDPSLVADAHAERRVVLEQTFLILMMTNIPRNTNSLWSRSRTVRGDPPLLGAVAARSMASGREGTSR